MYNFPIGVMVESFKLPFREAVEKAASLGVKGLQIGVAWHDMAPENLTEKAVKELLDIVKSNGLVVSATCADFGCGFTDTEKNPITIERSKRAMELSLLFETNIITTHIGAIPENKAASRYGVMQEACGQLAEYADKLNAHFAVETGPESAVILKEFLDGLGSKGVSVNLDPANLVMVAGDDPVKAVYTLKDYIVHTHAKDGIQLMRVPAEKIYGNSKDDEITCWDVAFEEKPLGEGKVDFPNYLKALDEIGFKGFLTIEREVGKNPIRDIELAVNFLQKNIKEN